MEPHIIETAARALGHLREAHNLLRERRIAYHHAWFLCVALASAFKDVLNQGAKKPKTPLETVVREVLDRRLHDEVAVVIVRLTRDSLIHAYELCYTDEEAVFTPDVYEEGVFVAETFTGATIHERRTVAGRTFTKGQVEGGSFLGQSPTEIVELVMAWCEQVMAEIEQEARDRGLAVT